MEKANLPTSISKEFCMKMKLLEVKLFDILHHFTVIQSGPLYSTSFLLVSYLTAFFTISMACACLGQTTARGEWGKISPLQGVHTIPTCTLSMLRIHKNSWFGSSLNGSKSSPATWSDSQSYIVLQSHHWTQVIQDDSRGQQEKEKSRKQSEKNPGWERIHPLLLRFCFGVLPDESFQWGVHHGVVTASHEYNTLTYAS